MGLIADIYKSATMSKYDGSNGGLSGKVDKVTIVNIPGPFEPTPDAPAARLEANTPGTVRVVPFAVPPGKLGPMDGGAYVSTCDSRFSDACERLTGSRFYGAVALHDRFETQAEYDALST